MAFLAVDWVVLTGTPIVEGHTTLACGPLHLRQEWRNLQSFLGQPRSELKLLQTSLCPTLTLGLPCMSVDVWV